MDDYCSPLGSAYFYQDEGVEELRHCLLYIKELEATIFSEKEEITRRECEIINLKDALNKTIKERNEAQEESQKLFLEKLLLQQEVKRQQQQEQQEEMQYNLSQETNSPLPPPPPPVSGTSSSEDSDFSNKKIISASQFDDPVHHQKPLQSQLPEKILKLAADRPLPEKGKLLQAVKEAGPLLQTLLLAGPLPQWQHPPPPLNSMEIPPVTISSPANRLIHQDSFNSFNNSCLSKKRSLELCGETSPDSSSSPNNKYQKVALH